MKTLAQLEKEAQSQLNCMEVPRMFLAIFPSGPKNGVFLDPYIGIIQIVGLEGVIYMSQLKGGFDIPASWVEGD